MLTPFWVALVNTYWYYNQGTLRNSSMFDEYGALTGKVTAGIHFTTMSECMHTLFWSMFGYADGSYTSIEPFNQPVTYWAGSILFGGYHIIVVIVCVNLLIALMTRTFDAVSEHEDVEWKYARTRLFLEYIEEGRTLAAPFNLIPSVKSIYKLMKDPFKYCRRKEQKDLHMSNVVIKLGMVHGRFYPNRAVNNGPIDGIPDEEMSDADNQKTAYEAVIIEIIDRLIDATLDDQEENKQ
ncbi:short transient receptor potential channel 7-like [Tubulanus polymorphus]|uniref:short transient receptor potential channel 7-like n=1 Tax=Tubulanus polymorphus TaxID=672921 RepID=UPI003DA5D3C6